MKFCAACNESFPDSESFCPKDGEVLQESPENIVGRLIDGKYKVEGFIAQGGMGAVYRARHILLGDQVVIKTLRSEMRNNAEWLKRFQREGKAARAFRHPNAVTVYDLSAGGDGQVYMVMEYVEGHTLDKELKGRGSFTPAGALEVLEPVADVLDSAHARGVVHRDLKPENIMLGRDDHGGTVVKVLDLGIAKIVGAGDAHAAAATSLTVAGQILGTPYYMSPEQWGELPRDGNPEVDGRTDIYSLGVIFFELIAGRKPLGGRTLSELRHGHVAETRPTLHEVAPQVPAGFSRAVASAMAKDRSDRPQTAGEFIDVLRASLGMPPRAARGRGAHATGAGQANLTGAGRSDASTHARGAEGGEDATGHLSPRGGAGLLGGNTADTLLTSEMDAPARDETARETIVSRALDTQADAGGDAARTSHDVRRQPSGKGVAHRHDAGRVVSAPEPRRPAAPLVAAGVLALLAVAGVVGWLALKDTDDGPRPPAETADAAAPAKPADAPKVEAASYWFEAFDDKEDETGSRVADASATLASGQFFRFHFTPKERGYLYIIGPYKDGNAQTTLLTAQGAGALKSNLVGAGADFVFPFGGTRFEIDDNAGADDFTFIFSPAPLMSPSFLTGKFLKTLTPEEVGELENFRAQFKSAAPEVFVKGEGGEGRVVVSAPQAATSEGKPLIFDVRINHK